MSDSKLQRQVTNRLPYPVFFYLVLDLESDHGFSQNLGCKDNISIDKSSKLRPVFLGVSLSMDDTHLFDKGTLSGFTSTLYRKRERERERSESD